MGTTALATLLYYSITVPSRPDSSVYTAVLSPLSVSSADPADHPSVPQLLRPSLMLGAGQADYMEYRPLASA